MFDFGAAAVRIDDPLAWLTALSRPRALSELAAIAACVLVAWGVAAGLRRWFAPQQVTSVLFGRRVLDGALFPLLLLLLVWMARAAFTRGGPMVVFPVAVPVLIALATLRLGVRILAAAFPQSGWMRLIERTLSWLAWGAMLLWVTGVLPFVMEELDAVRWKLGGTTVSLRALIEGALTAGLVLLLALWLSAALEARLLRSASGDELSVRKAISNALRALLLFVGLMLALSAAGLDLTALSVLGGAVGVGIGFGLQKLAANYVSGFVILAERSMRIGDHVRVDNFEGRITDIRARFTVVRSLTGRESIVPNELLITSRVENLSLADTHVWQSTVVSVAYDSDVELVQRLLLEAAQAQPRVMREPAPSVALSAFGADGLEFTVGYWIADPQNGQLNLRSQINLSILQSLREHGIEIPFPQRVVHAAPGRSSAAMGPASAQGPSATS